MPATSSIDRRASQSVRFFAHRSTRPRRQTRPKPTASHAPFFNERFDALSAKRQTLARFSPASNQFAHIRVRFGSTGGNEPGNFLAVPRDDDGLAALSTFE